METKKQHSFSKINIKNYFSVISITGIVSLVWLLLLPSDSKTAWIFGYSKSRLSLLGIIILAVLPFILIWLRMLFDEDWLQKFIYRMDALLRKNLFWMIILLLSSVGFVVGMCILSVAFGLTDIFLRNVFLRLAPWAFWITVVCILNWVYFWYGDYCAENDFLLKIDMQSWVSRYDVSSRNLFLIFLFPTLYIAFYFALWKSQPDHSFALRFMGENNPIELITFLALLFGGIQGIKLSWLAQQRGEAIWVWAFFVVFAVGIIFVGFEEIAWGQQFIAIKTPAALKEINLQNEITFHNIDSVQGSLGGLIRLFGWFGMIGILLSFSKRFQIIGVSPILILWVSMILVLSYLSLFIYSVLPSNADDLLQDVLTETGEMFVGLVSYCYFWFQTRMLSYGQLRKAFAKNLTIARELLILELMDGRTVSIPSDWIPHLNNASEKELMKWELINSGLTIHWPDLDIKIRVEQLLSGVPPIEDRPLLDNWWIR